MLRFKLAYLQLFSDWLIYVFHFYLLRVGFFNFFKYMLRYFCKTILTGTTRFILRFKMAYLQQFSDWRMFVSTISSGTSGILWVVQYISYNLKSPPYAPVVYVQNIKMCIHSQKVRISTFPILVLFRGYSSGANQIYAMIQNGHCKRFIFEIIRYSKAGGHHVRSLVF